MGAMIAVICSGCYLSTSSLQPYLYTSYLFIYSALLYVRPEEEVHKALSKNYNNIVLSFFKQLSRSFGLSCVIHNIKLEIFLKLTFKLYFHQENIAAVIIQQHSAISLSSFIDQPLCSAMLFWQFLVIFIFSPSSLAAVLPQAQKIPRAPISMGWQPWDQPEFYSFFYLFWSDQSYALIVHIQLSNDKSFYSVYVLNHTALLEPSFLLMLCRVTVFSHSAELWSWVTYDFLLISLYFCSLSLFSHWGLSCLNVSGRILSVGAFIFTFMQCFMFFLISL